MKKTIFQFLMILLMGWPLMAGAKAETPLPKMGFDMSDLREIAILDQGRQKPLDTFSRETIRFITGKEKFLDFEPSELILSWLTQTDLWEEQALINIGYRPLIKHLRLPAMDHRISPKALRQHQEFALFLQTVQSRQEEGLDLSEMEREGGLLQERLNRFYKIAEGSNLNLIPRKEGGWDSLALIAKRFPKISLDQAPPSEDARIAAGVQGMLAAYYQNDPVLFSEITLLLKNILRKRGEGIQNYPSPEALKREVHFNGLKPFRWAWMGYSLAAFLLLLSFGLKGRVLYYLGMGIFVLAFGMHTYGFILRIWIAGRPPVTNMYETVLWIPYGAVLFALVLETIYRSRFFAIAAASLAALGLIVAQSAPSILDPAINPLVPVLRDNFWLTVHVLTITLSYGAFTLALGIANINAGYYIFRPQKKDKLRRLNFFTYRAIQIGVVLLAAGTILGGVWANQSWGRFWGWDPKEVWALIALLGYLVILHGRHAGWIKGIGLTVGSIIAYLLVLMAWYGVNFILGVGLHSYGFSSGGAKFVSIFTGLEIGWVLVALIRTKLMNGRDPLSASRAV